MTICPFCGHDPYHYVDNGLGMEAVAITCCEIGIEYFAREPKEYITISREEMDELADKLREMHQRLDLPVCPSDRDGIIQECLDEQPSTAENPNEDAYQRGRFDGVMEFASAIQELKSDHGDPRTMTE